jgi:hypothetical protein
MSIKCYIRYWTRFAFKKHGLTLELTMVKLSDQANIIKDKYDTHKLIIWIKKLLKLLDYI